MKNTVTGILIFALAGFATYSATVFLTPYVILLVVKMKSKSEFNQPVYAGVISGKDRFVVLPNPDFIYVASGYDIRKAPVRISGALPEDTYSSVALYAANTRNFFIQNDRQTPDRMIDFLLVKEGEGAKYAGKGEMIVESPTTLGTMLVRILINDTSRIGYLQEMQKTFVIIPQQEQHDAQTGNSDYFIPK